MEMPRIEITSDLEELPRLVDFIDGFVEEHALPMKLGMQLQLALEELATNVIQHGYGGKAGTIRLALERDGETVRAVLIDRAPAYDPFATAAPDLEAGIDEREIGGLGVHLVREMAETVDYARCGDENHVMIAIRT